MLFWDWPYAFQSITRNLLKAFLHLGRVGMRKNTQGADGGKSFKLSMTCGYFEDRTKQGLLLRQNVVWEVSHFCVVFVCTHDYNYVAPGIMDVGNGAI